MQDRNWPPLYNSLGRTLYTCTLYIIPLSFNTLVYYAIMLVEGYSNVLVFMLVSTMLPTILRKLHVKVLVHLARYCQIVGNIICDLDVKISNYGFVKHLNLNTHYSSILYIYYIWCPERATIGSPSYWK